MIHIIPSTTFYNLSEEIQKKILDSAFELFSRQTYEELNVRYISNKLGITTGRFYRYFKSKEGLYVHLVDYALYKFWDLQKEYEKELGRPVDMQEVLDRSREHAGFWKLFYQSSLDIRRGYYFRTQGNPLFARMQKEVGSFKAGRDYSPLEKDITAFLLSTLQYTITSYKYLEGLEFDDEEMFQHFRRMIVQGYEAEDKNTGN